MIEAIMYFSIGFFIAVVIGLGLFPLVHNRAVRLTGQRLEAATPLSLAEIQADKDQLRAEFAMTIRRLEMSVDQLKARTTSQAGEIGRKTDAVNRMKMEIGEKAAVLLTMEAKEQGLRDQLRATEENLATRTNTLQLTEQTLAEKFAELEKQAQQLGESTLLADSQRVEIAALRTQVESLRGQIENLETDLRQTQAQRMRERAEAETTVKEVEAERGRTLLLGTRLADLEQQLIAQANEGQGLSRKVLELEARASEQNKKFGEREYDVIRLRTEVETVRQAETEARSEMSAMEDRHNGTSARLRSEKSLLEKELEQSRNECAVLQDDVARLKREAEEGWAGERTENELLRERINDIATEVARLTMVLEGPGSAIEAMLAKEANGHAPKAGAGSEATLADRIRALQARAAQVAPPQA